jgi:iron(III) transport system substrate-binding protein
VVKSVKVSNPELESLGNFKADNLAVGTIGVRQVAAQKLLDRVNYK